MGNEPENPDDTLIRKQWVTFVYFTVGYIVFVGFAMLTQLPHNGLGHAAMPGEHRSTQVGLVTATLRKILPASW